MTKLIIQKVENHLYNLTFNSNLKLPRSLQIEIALTS